MTVALFWGLVATVALDATAPNATCWKGFKLGQPFKSCQVISPVIAVYWKVSKTTCPILDHQKSMGDFNSDLKIGTCMCAQVEQPSPGRSNSTEQTVLIGIDVVQPYTGSWIGLGLSEGGGMRGSDLWIIGPKFVLSGYAAASMTSVSPKQVAGKNKQFMVLDTWSNDTMAPMPDAEQVSRINGSYIAPYSFYCHKYGAEI